MSVIENYRRIMDTVAETAVRHGRTPGEIRIVAVSKTFPAGTVQHAIDDGIFLFGENKVQEAKSKIPVLKGSFDFHLVGHLQSNKAKDAVVLFSLIHSIDKFSTAVKVDQEAAKTGKIQKILVQVNTSEEASKSGIDAENSIELCRQIISLRNLELLGLMTIGPLGGDDRAVRSSFISLRNLLAEVNTFLGLELKELSMGMSSDYIIAVEEGATLLRIGTSIFGGRGY